MKLSKIAIEKNISCALEEDIGTGDLTASLLPEDLIVEAEIIAREPLVVCGIPWVDAVFCRLDSRIKIHWWVEEGMILEKPQTLCQITGPARAILTGERTALNFLQTLSATASKTYEFVKALKGSKTKLLDTRKTLPGLRLAQKYAVALAGGVNHRIGLYDAFLIKENHIRACGSITKAIHKARALSSKFLEIEVENLLELEEALKAKPDRILLDNFTIPMMVDAIKINQNYACSLEASGNVSLENITQIAQTGVDYISVGEITKSLKAVDLSLLIKEAP